MKLLGFSIFLICSLSTSVSAQISVNDVIVHFKAGARPVQNVIVKNSAKEVFYVTATCEELTEPSEDKSPLVPTDDLIVSPKKFSIDGNNERVVRLLHRKGQDAKERVYRVSFVPQEKAFGEPLVGQSGDRKTLLRVITGMGILVFIDPINPNPELKWIREGNAVTFSNSGNQHVRLSEGKACDAEGVGCTELPSRRVYGGKKFVITVPEGKTIYYTRRDSPTGDFKSLVIAP